jgi:hypothetical protein
MTFVFSVHFQRTSELFNLYNVTTYFLYIVQLTFYDNTETSVLSYKYNIPDHSKISTIFCKFGIVSLFLSGKESLHAGLLLV